MLLGQIDPVPVLVSFLSVLVLTPLVRAQARRRGLVARPRSDRWHQKPTAMLGGVAIFASVAGVDLALVPLSPRALVVVGTSTLLFLVGQVDDLVCLKPRQKLLCQSFAAAVAVALGLSLPWTGAPVIDHAITVMWLVGITNAINLLDNMDGLAAGIAAIASFFLAFDFLGSGQSADALLLAVFGSALAGFLVYNAKPASIFMGDGGSMFIGFFLAGAVLMNPAEARPPYSVPRLAMPVLILLIPIFDTLFVMVLRKCAGRSIVQGGKDHTSHRLVALGLSERHAVWMLYGIAMISGFLGLTVPKLPPGGAAASILAALFSLALLAFGLARVKVYDNAVATRAATRPPRRIKASTAATRFS
jgi:UDP-GlcNAc:undecaprenyl-phosphate GlcNAc-1-phosphate transferase